MNHETRCAQVKFSGKSFSPLVFWSFGLRLASLVLLLAAAPSVVRAQEARRGYDIPAADAVKSLKQFSEQSGKGLIVASETVKGVRTNAVRGDFTAGDALTRLLEGTGLIASRDQESGAFAVRRESNDPNAPGTAQAPAGDRSRDSKKKT